MSIINPSAINVFRLKLSFGASSTSFPGLGKQLIFICNLIIKWYFLGTFECSKDEQIHGSVVEDFPAVFFHISHWYLSWNTEQLTNPSHKSQLSRAINYFRPPPEAGKGAKTMPQTILVSLYPPPPLRAMPIWKEYISKRGFPKSLWNV